VPGVDIDVERENVLVPANHEVFIKIFPEVTLADEEIRTIPVVSFKYNFQVELCLSVLNAALLFIINIITALLLTGLKGMLYG